MVPTPSSETVSDRLVGRVLELKRHSEVSEISSRSRPRITGERSRYARAETPRQESLGCAAPCSPTINNLVQGVRGRPSEAAGPTAEALALPIALQLTGMADAGASWRGISSVISAVLAGHAPSARNAWYAMYAGRERPSKIA